MFTINKKRFYQQFLLSTKNVFIFTIQDIEMEELFFAEDLEFVARTVRLFKPPGEEVLAESQITYTGEILGNEKEWVFDIDHKFKVILNEGKG